MRPFLMATICASLLYGLLSLACMSSGTPVAGGGSSETVIGMVVDTVGRPSQQSTVRLRRSDYFAAIPSLAKTALYGADALTDSNGRFEIIGVDPGSYRIEVGDGQSAVLFACSIGVNDTVDLGIGTLQPYATVAGTVDTAGRAGQRLYVQVDGMERLAAADASGRFALSDLPAGKFTIRAITAQDTMIAAASSVTVAPGERTEVTMLGGWRFSKRLYLNTTASGANVNEVVTNFPLLVRLGSTTLTNRTIDFDFTQARDSGQDVRFTRTDGTPLPFEIERWDPVAKRAEVWVRMDTVRGNNLSQFVVMHWGNASAVSISDGATVFDTTDGYMRVFHLGNSAREATVYHADGTATKSLDTNGYIASGTYFNGINDSIGFPVPHQDTIMLSAWVYAQTAGSSLYPTIIQTPAYGINFGFANGLKDHSITFWTSNVSNTATASWESPMQSIGQGMWYYVVVAYDASSIDNAPFIYINGVPVPVTVEMPPGAPGTDPTAGRGFIGNNVMDAPWHGIIDEVRISKSIRSAAWIKLSYENQKVGATLLNFGN